MYFIDKNSRVIIRLLDYNEIVRELERTLTSKQLAYRISPITEEESEILESNKETSLLYCLTVD